MNDEEARQFIDSQPGATVLDREVMATTKLMEDENIAMFFIKLYEQTF